MKKPTLGLLLGYFAALYVLLLLFLAVMYPFAQTYAKPIASLIFPLNPNNSLPKMMIVVSAFYWASVAAMLVGHLLRKK